MLMRVIRWCVLLSLNEGSIKKSVKSKKQHKKTRYKGMQEEKPMHPSHNPERRRFMKTVGLGTAAAGAAAAVGHVTLAQASSSNAAVLPPAVWPPLALWVRP